MTTRSATPVYRGYFEQILFYHDGPQLILLKTGRNSKVLAVGVEEVHTKSFFGAKISQKQFKAYLQEKFDLRYVILNPDSDMWFEFDLSEDQIKVNMTPVSPKPDVLSVLAPDHGIFARDHTEEYASLPADVRSVQTFLVDGNWDMREFSRFHAQVSDLYALTKSVDMYDDVQTDVKEKKKLVDAFIKPWKGGGSYLGFFRSLARVGGEETRPDIKSIQWASPGSMQVLGDASSFRKIIDLVDDYGEAEKPIKDAYQHLWSYLSEHKLLKSAPGSLDTKSPIAAEILIRARDLASKLSFERFDLIETMAGRNPLVAAKVILAAERRIDKLHAFFAQGRIAVSEEAID